MQLTINNSTNGWLTQLPKILCSISLTLLCCTACDQQADEEAATAGLQTFDTTYRVVTNASYPPFEDLDATGNVIGFDVDLLEAIGQEEGFNVTFESRPWVVLFDDLKKGQADIIASSVWITDERKQNYGVSNPYYQSPMSLLTLQSDTQTLPDKYTDIKDQTIAVAIGGENDAFFEKFLSAKNQKLTSKSSYVALQNLMTDKAQYVSDAQVRLDHNIHLYKSQLNEGESFVIVNDPQFPVWEWGILVKKNNVKLLDKINSGLEKIQQNGTYDKIYEKWFHEKPASAIPSTATN
ncbi:transporter substrate-binding domain-containing protein [Psychrobacter sp. I-STPA10]|uniref:transporter substrate-binding domain-containing protein n=1 Tax=Psychrobacter sp. I-STPA10 TaxID=2585769 RepID=UPI001E606E94|nr:transporter substrate-binding domain-containing protein [Psychrobacter sp. I-STPA10]